MDEEDRNDPRLLALDSDIAKLVEDLDKKIEAASGGRMAFGIVIFIPDNRCSVRYLSNCPPAEAILPLGATLEALAQEVPNSESEVVH